MKAAAEVWAFHAKDPSKNYLPPQQYFPGLEFQELVGLQA